MLIYKSLFSVSKITSCHSIQFKSLVNYICLSEFVKIYFISAWFQLIFSKKFRILLSKWFNHNVALNRFCSITQKQSNVRIFVVYFNSFSIRTICANNVPWNVNNKVHFQCSLLIHFKSLELFVLFCIELLGVTSQKECSDVIIVIR